MKEQVVAWQRLDDWFYSPQGCWVSDSFIEALSPFMHELRGESLLQMGQCGTNPWLNKLSYLHKYIASPYSGKQSNQVLTDMHKLPFDRLSFDCIIAPLTVEFFHNAATLIDEMDRVLKSMGFLVIFGINPFSMWGFGSKLGLLTGLRDQSLYLHSSFRINRLCISRGFQQRLLSNFGYIPPVRSKKWIQQFFFLDEIGKMIWPFPAGFYCYVAQKLETPYTLAAPAYKEEIEWHPLVT